MGKVKVILYRKDGSEVGKLELDADKDIREQLLPLKSRLGIYAYEVKTSWIDKVKTSWIDELKLFPLRIFLPPMPGSPRADSDRIVL